MGEAQPFDHRVAKVGFTDMALENLKRLVESKSVLIKKALGTDYTPNHYGRRNYQFSLVSR